MGYSAGFWIGFHVLIAILLAADLKLFDRKRRAITFRWACLLSALWVGVALLFNAGVYHYLGADRALQFFTGYLVEKSLSVDNLFLFLIIFTHFKIPAIHYHKILFWGMIGALFFRITLILGGLSLIEHFHWMFYVFGAFLLISGLKLLMVQKKTDDPTKGLLYRLLTKILPVAKGEMGAFFVRRGGRWKVTSLFLALLMIECTDIVFALDSIPAVFAITTDPFIVYTSNIFAILGLRALYFVLVSSLKKLRYIKVGLSAILVFVGAKMLFGEYVAISTLASLGIIFAILLVTAVAGAFKPRRG